MRLLSPPPSGAESIRRGTLNASRIRWNGSGSGPDGPGAPPPEWITRSPRLGHAYALAAEAHRNQRRAADRTLFLDHVMEVGSLLEGAGFDESLVAAGLLHDSVERGTISRERLLSEMGEEVSTLVLALTEDAAIERFGDRKEALRAQVRDGGSRAITIFAADKLSDIRGFRRALDTQRDSVESRIGTTVERMASHYRDSVAMIDESEPDCEFGPELHAELEGLATIWAMSQES